MSKVTVIKKAIKIFLWVLLLCAVLLFLLFCYIGIYAIPVE